MKRSFVCTPRNQKAREFEAKFFEMEMKSKKWLLEEGECCLRIELLSSQVKLYRDASRKFN